MSANNHEQIKKIAARFEEAGNGNRRPLISDFLSQDDPASRQALLAELISLGIQFRIRNGESPRSADYSQLGSQAVEFACRELDEAIESKYADIDETAFDPEIMVMSSDDLKGRGDFTVDDVETESTFIDPYKLLQVIGEGGMGSVWMAERFEPVRCICNCPSADCRCVFNFDATGFQDFSWLQCWFLPVA